MSEASSTVATSAEKRETLTRAWYSLGLLTVIYLFSFIDRQIISLMVDPIKRDLGISDTQISLLQGLAFAIFYTTLGIPIAKLADRHLRKGIISIGVGLWSMMTMACGLANNYAQMFLARMGVGVGEAALSPAAYSIINDAFPDRLKSRAFAIYSMGISLGGGVAYMAGGYVVEQASSVSVYTLPIIGDIKPWQLVFMIAGAPGLLLAILAMTMLEPKRKHAELPPQSNESTAVRKTQGSLSYLYQHRRLYLPHFLGFALLSLISYSYSAWMPSAILRKFDISVAEVGLLFGLITCIGGAVGLYLAAFLADKLNTRARDGGDSTQSGAQSVAVYCALAIAISGTIPPLMNNEAALWISLCVFALFASTWAGLAPAILSSITSANRLASTSAYYLLSINLIGLGLGPSVVALISDYAFASSNIGVAISISCLCAAPVSALLLRSLKMRSSYDQDSSPLTEAPTATTQS